MTSNHQKAWELFICGIDPNSKLYMTLVIWITSPKLFQLDFFINSVTNIIHQNEGQDAQTCV